MSTIKNTTVELLSMDGPAFKRFHQRCATLFKEAVKTPQVAPSSDDAKRRLNALTMLLTMLVDVAVSDADDESVGVIAIMAIAGVFSTTVCDWCQCGEDAAVADFRRALKAINRNTPSVNRLN